MRGRRLTGLTLGLGALTLLLVSPPNMAWSSDNSKNWAQSSGGQLNQPTALSGALDLTALESITMNNASSQAGPLPLAPSAGSFIMAAQAAAAETAEDGQSVVTLETITVQADRPDWERILSPGAVDVIVPDDFKGEQKKLPEYLQMVPGLHVEVRGSEGQYSTVTMRGSTSAQVNIFIDGVPQNLGGDSAVDLSLIPMSNIARIEVYRGYTPARFAGAPIGGVINIVTKKPEGFGGSASVGAKSLHGRTADATVTGPLFSGSLLLGLHRDQSHGDFKYDFYNNSNYVGCGNSTNPQPCTRWRQSNQYQNTDVLLKWQDDNWYTKAAWKRTSRYYPNETNGGYTGTGNPLLVDYDPAHTWHRYQKVDQYDFMLGRRQTWGDLEWGLEANYMKQEKEYWLMETVWDPDHFNMNYVTRPGLAWNTYDTERYGASLDGSYKLRDNHLLEFRADFFKENLEMDGNTTDSLTEGGGYGEGLGGGWAAWGTKGALTYKRDTWHAQISDTITLNDDKDLWLTLIGRYDKVKDTSDVRNPYYLGRDNDSGHVTWGLALKKEIGDSWVVRGTAGSFVRYPNFYELYGDGVYVIPGMAGLPYNMPERETGHQWDLGFDWRGDIFKGRGNFSATYFGRRTENMIFPRYSPLFGTIHYVNGGLTEAFGTELEAGLQWKKFDLNATATWQKTKLLMKKEAGLLRDEGDELALMPEWEAHFRATYRPFGDDELSLFAEHHYTGKMIENWSNSLNTDEWQRQSLNITGLGARYKMPWGFTLTAGVDDVFNQQRRQKITYVGTPNPLMAQHHGLRYPSQGRTWYVTLDYLFGGGSASDSSGTGSNDPKAVSAMNLTEPEAEAAGGSGGASPFYIAPKLVYTRQKAKVGPRHWEIGPGQGGQHDTFNPSYLDPAHAGAMPSLPGLQKNDSYFGGALAFGVDFHKISNVPLRLEVEAGTHYDGRVEQGGLPRLDKRWGAEIDFANQGIFGPEAILAMNDSSRASETQLDYRNHLAFINLYYDFHNSSRFTPYIGAGAGVSFTRTRVRTTNDITILANQAGFFWPTYNEIKIDFAHEEETQRSTNFAWNASVGCSYQLSEGIDLDLSYRYVNTGHKEKTKGFTRREQYLDHDTLGELWAAETFVEGVEIDLREAHQAVMALRFSF